MPNQIRELEVSEVSVCRVPANAEFIKGKRINRSTIALFKNDESEESSMSNLETVLKNDSADQLDIETAAWALATELFAKSDGTRTVEQIWAADVWSNPTVWQKHQQAPPPSTAKLAKIAKAEAEANAVTITRTLAEDEIAKMAEERYSKSDGSRTFEQVYVDVIDENPALYAQHLADEASGALVKIKQV